MKKLLNIFSALLLFNLFVASVCLAQSDTHNYVVKDVMQDADGKVLKHMVVDYTVDKEVFRRVTTNNYDEAMGILVSADVSTSMDGANADDLICQDGEPRMFLFDGGYAGIKDNALVWHYYVTDHLGSKRIVQDEQGKVEATYNYYPFGTIFDHFAEIYAKPISQPFKFNGKELDTMYGLYGYDFGARLYDPLLGRWFGIDPLCEKYYSWSPYVFCLDNPISYLDSDGQVVIKSIVAAFRYAKKAYKIYERTGKLSVRSLQKAGIAEIADMAGDLYTLFDGEASTLDKIKGGVDLILGTDLNNKGSQKVVNFVKKNVLKSESTLGKSKGSLSGTKKALANVKIKLGLQDGSSLPKNKGKFGSPSRGNQIKGYRLDPAHDNREGSGEEFPHINYWDFSNGKRNKGGIVGVEPIIE